MPVPTTRALSGQGLHGAADDDLQLGDHGGMSPSTRAGVDPLQLQQSLHRENILIHGLGPVAANGRVNLGRSFSTPPRTVLVFPISMTRIMVNPPFPHIPAPSAGRNAGRRFQYSKTGSVCKERGERRQRINVTPKPRFWG